MARQGRLPSRAGRLVYRHGRAGWPQYTDPSSPVTLQIQKFLRIRTRRRPAIVPVEQGERQLSSCGTVGTLALRSLVAMGIPWRTWGVQRRRCVVNAPRRQADSENRAPDRLPRCTARISCGKSESCPACKAWASESLGRVAKRVHAGGRKTHRIASLAMQRRRGMLQRSGP